MRVDQSPEGWTVVLSACGATGRLGRRPGRLAERLQSLDAVVGRRLAAGATVKREVRVLSSTLAPRLRPDGVFSSEDLVRPLLLPRRVDDSLYPYQRRGVAWLLRNKRALLADDMGLGKTAQAICAARRLIRCGIVGWGVVVAPRTLLANWVAESKKWAPELCVLSLQPLGSRRADVWRRAVRRAHLLVTSYEQLRDPPAALLEVPPDFVIADEAHRLRRRESESHRGFRTVRTEWLWALTGTPVERDAEDFAVLMSLLDDRRFSPEDRVLHPSALRARARPYVLRRRKDEVLAELPPVIESDEELELTAAQTEAYRRAIRAHTGGSGASSYLALFSELRSLCDLEPMSGSSAKLDRICNIVDEVAAAGEKAVIFSYLLSPLYELERRFRRTGVGCEMLIGDMGLLERNQALARFRKDTRCVALLASSRVGAEGLTLTEANHVIFVNRWWNPSANAQARDRVLRIGQTKVVCVWGFACRGTVETGLRRILDEKQRTFDALVGALGKSSASECEWLLSEP